MRIVRGKNHYKGSINSISVSGTNVDGAEVVSDIPAMLSVGLTRRPSNRFMFYPGIHYYFDKPIDFDGSQSLRMDMIEKNSLFTFAL